MVLKNKWHQGIKSGPIIFKMCDMNIARALNRVANGDESVKLAAPLNKKFQKIKKLFPQENSKQKVIFKYDPHRLWPDKFLTDLEKLGAQRYEAAKHGTFQIYPSSHRDNFDAIELLYADGSGKRKNVTIQHELYLDYGVEEAMMYARHAAAMKETYRLYPEVLAGADPHAFWSAILWVDKFMSTLRKLQVPSDLLDEWQVIKVGKQRSLDHFKDSMKLSRFDPAMLRSPEDNWGITSNENQHVKIATDYTICSIEAMHKALKDVKGVSSVVVLTCGQFKGTEMWRYIRATTMFKEMQEDNEKQTGREMPYDECIILYRQCMERLGFDKSSKHWEGPAFMDISKPINDTTDTELVSSIRRRMKINDAPDEIKNQHVIDWIVENFLRILMIPILGTDYDSPMMWNVLYKKGAKERIHSHMVNSFIEYISINVQYQSKDAIERLVGLKWSSGSILFDREPIFRAMQDKLYSYLKREEVSYD